MTFLYPSLLLGLLGLAGPIAAHLIHRARPRPIPWAAMKLLRQATVTRSRHVRLEDTLLLLLRCLAMALLVLALSRPTLTVRDTPGSTPGSHTGSFVSDRRAVGAVLALDASLSMAHRSGPASRLERAAGVVTRIADTLEPGSPVSVLVMGQRPRVLLWNSPYQHEALASLLAQVQPTFETLDVEANLDALRELVGDLNAPRRECYIVTDAQATTWAGLSEAARAGLKELRKTAAVRFVPVDIAGYANAALVDLSRSSGLPFAGGLSRYVATVRNFGPAPLAGVTVTLAADDRPVDQRTIDVLPAGGEATVTMFLRHAAAGATRVVAWLGPDALEADNHRYLVTFVRSRVSVLCVDGAPGVEPFTSQTDYLARAIAPRPGAGLAAVRVIPWTDLPRQRFDDVDVVVLANLPDIDPEQVAALRRFVERGGGLVVFPGDRTDPARMNLRLTPDGQSLLPATIGQAFGDERAPRHALTVRIESPDHALTAVLAPLPADLVGQAHVYRGLTLTPAPDARVLLTLLPDRQPLLVEHTVGLGKVLLWATTAGRDWSDLVTHPAYPMLLQQSLVYLTTRPWEQPLRVGDARAPSLPGFSELSAGGDEPIVLAVNVDGRESDVRALDEAGVSRLCAETGMMLVRDDDALTRTIQRGRSGLELWRPLLVAALVMLLFEALLAARFMARMSAGQSVTIRRGRGRAALPGRALTASVTVSGGVSGGTSGGASGGVSGGGPRELGRIR